MDFAKLKEELFGHVDIAIKENLDKIVGPLAAEKIAEVVKEARLSALITGDKGLADDAKLAFVKDVQAIARGEKAAYLGSSDQSGGYLLTTEVHNEILRIAKTTGLIVRDARNWPMGTDALEIPVYTGATLQGNYQGEDEEGDEEYNDIGEVVLQSKYWQTIIRAGNRLLKNANVSLADWFLAMAAEGLAYRIDREGFMGGTYAGSPFVGMLADASGSTVQTLGSGLTGFEDITPEEASIAIGSLPTAALQDAAFYFHRTVWARIRTQKDGSGRYVFNQDNTMLATMRRESGIQPVGALLDYPVFTTDVLPAYSASAASTKFGVFANLKLALAFGDKGPMEVAKSTDATVGGKSLFRANQTAFRFSHEHALTQVLPEASVALKTAAS
jgi:HK97 family phage major capsid protein